MKNIKEILNRAIYRKVIKVKKSIDKFDFTCLNFESDADVSLLNCFDFIYDLNDNENIFEKSFLYAEKTDASLKVVSNIYERKVRWFFIDNQNKWNYEIVSEKELEIEEIISFEDAADFFCNQYEKVNLPSTRGCCETLQIYWKTRYEYSPEELDRIAYYGSF